MNVYPTIEALLRYANTHLLFDELDFCYARNRILELLKLDDYEEYEINDEEIEEMNSADDLLETLATYAVNEGVIEQGGVKLLKKKLMDCVLLRPSEVADVFSGLSPAKGFEWLNEYGVKSGYIRTPLKKWEAKATKGKIEVSFVDCCGCCDLPRKYPECKFCRENEGRNGKMLMRTVPVELAGERMFFYYHSHALVSGLANIVGEYHRPVSVDARMLNKMFEFIDMMPSWVIAAKAGEHERYVASPKLLPLNKAEDLNRYKSATYPYIAITTIDWYFGAVRLACTNREKLIEYALKLIDMRGGKAAVSLRKIESKYCVEIMFIGDKVAENGLTKADSVTELMGEFALNSKIRAQIEEIEKYLTKQEAFTPSKLEGEMGVHADMINRLLREHSNTKLSALEASLDVRDEVNATLEAALTSLGSPLDDITSNL